MTTNIKLAVVVVQFGIELITFLCQKELVIINIKNIQMIFKLNFSDKTEYVQDKSQLDLIRNYQSEIDRKSVV